VNRALFDRLAGSLDAPTIVVTTTDGVERSGCLVGFHTQCSIEPPRWLVGISQENHTLRVARSARYLAVHLLRADQRALAELFGGATEDTVDKFARCAWRPGPGDVPILAGCDWLVGRIMLRVDLGDHEGHLLDVVDVGSEHAAAPQLGFQAVKDIRPGHPA
jgi:flavin reductase (DIM6/NTAB) family NADH-FMN oxidoreductase RutF